MRPNLPPVAVADRITRLRASLAAEGADAILVTRLPNVRYLTGFTGSAGLLLVTAEDAIFVTDGRYREQAGEQLDAAGATIEIGIGVAEGAQLVVDGRGHQVAGFEGGFVVLHHQDMGVIAHAVLRFGHDRPHLDTTWPRRP